MLKGQYGPSEDKDAIIEKMRENLTLRNGDKDEYRFNYTATGRNVLISLCDYNGLLEVDGDMCPMGL